MHEEIRRARPLKREWLTREMESAIFIMIRSLRSGHLILLIIS
jgi:hypothetical protein